MASKYDEKEAAKDTDVPEGEVRRAWHNARNDSDVREKKEPVQNRQKKDEDE